MLDRPSMPADSPHSGGQITRVSVTYTIPTEEGRWHSILGLKMMREYARPGRVPDLVYDLAVICEEVIAARPARSEVSVLPANVARLPFQPPPARSEAYRNRNLSTCMRRLCGVITEWRLPSRVG